MPSRTLHPREEPYRWAIERLDEAFGRESVRVIPRQHHHVIQVAITGDTGGRLLELTLRNPTYDMNREEDREAVLGRWIADSQERLRGAAGASPPPRPADE